MGVCVFSSLIKPGLAPLEINFEHRLLVESLFV